MSAAAARNATSGRSACTLPPLHDRLRGTWRVRIRQRPLESLRTGGRHAEESISMTSTAINMYVFIFAFASAFLLGQKRPMLALSTRALLAVLLGLAIGYAMSAEQWYRGYLGVATLIANVLFIAFAAIDFISWQKKRLEDRG